MFETEESEDQMTATAGILLFIICTFAGFVSKNSYSLLFKFLSVSIGLGLPAYFIYKGYKKESPKNVKLNPNHLLAKMTSSVEAIDGISLPSDSPELNANLESNHQFIFGATGAGKTTGAIYPQVKDEIQQGSSVFILDPKGDLDFRDFVYSAAIESGREDAFFYFSITKPDISDHFSVIKDLSPTEVRDLIINLGEWSEPHYKKVATAKLQEILNKNRIFDLKAVSTQLPNDENLSGLKADLEILTGSDFGQKISSGNGDSIKDMYLKNKICFFSLDSQAFPEASKHVGLMILGGLMNLSNWIQTNLPREKRNKSTVVIDEFGTFATGNFITYLNKARSSNTKIILATQSLGDLSRIGEHFTSQVFDSTPVKIIMRVDDPKSTERCSDFFGTRKVQKFTYQYDYSNMEATEKGSVRDADEFIVHPNMIKQMNVHEAYILSKSPFGAFKLKFRKPEKNKYTLQRIPQELHIQKNKDETTTEKKIIIPKGMLD